MVNRETNDTSIRPFQFYCHLLILQLMNGSLIKEIINQKKQNLLYIIIFIIKNRINVLFFCFFKERNLFILISYKLLLERFMRNLATREK